MSKRTNPKAIGIFVVGAVALSFVALAMFGSGALFVKSHPFIMFFPGDLNGLNVGAPVKFRGVKIGSVTGIRLQLVNVLQSASSKLRMPVTVELDESAITVPGPSGASLSSAELIRQAISKGLRAQLATESFVTGILYVSLDMRPDTKAEFYLPQNPNYVEIPTLPTTLEQAGALLEQVLAQMRQADLPGLVKSAHTTFQATSELVSSPELKAAVVSFDQAARNLSRTAASIRNTSDSLNVRMVPLLRSLQAASDNAAVTMRNLQSASARANETLGAAHQMIEPNSPLNYQLYQALVGLTDASRSIQQLADYLERNPGALLRGRAAARDGR